MNIQGLTSGYAFSRNPIIITNDWPSRLSKTGTYYIEYNGAKIYEGCFYPPLSINLSEIADAAIDFFPEPPADNENPLIMIEDAENFRCRTLYAQFDYDGNDCEIECVVVPGGIPSRSYRQITGRRKDIFTERFLNPGNNFFLTTRSASWRIVIRETELYPLYFLGRPDINFYVKELCSGLKFHPESNPDGVCALDIAALRKHFFTEYGIIPSIFDVFCDDSFSCRIVIERAIPSKDRYLIKFRNSLGVFELIEITENFTVTPEYEEADDAAFKRYDPVSDCFLHERDRIERKLSLSTEILVKNEERIRFLMDMIASEEVYLIGILDMPVKAIPSIDGFSHALHPESPETLSLKLDISDREMNIMQDMIDGSEGVKPKVFSPEFSKQFN